MEHLIQLHIEKLPEGGYLATSDAIQGQETLDIARDVAKKLIEAQADPCGVSLTPMGDGFDYPLVVAT